MNNENVTKTDVVIVGGGLAGLSAAIYLARAGWRVSLFEKASHLGGRAATQMYDGFAFNRGAHAFYAGSAGTPVLRELGVKYGYGNPRGIQIFHEGHFSIAPASVGTLMRTDFLSPGEKWEFLNLFTRLTMTKLAGLGGLSTRAWLEREVRGTHLRKVLTAYARTLTYCANLEMMSAEVFLQRLTLSDIRYIDGGWQTLVDTLVDLARKAGVQIVSGTRVNELLQQGKSIEGVRLDDGRLVGTRAVLLAVTPEEALKLLEGTGGEAIRQQIAAIQPARIACLDVALSRLPVPEHAIVFDLEHPRFLTTQSLYARVAPAGGALIHTFKQLDPAQPGDPRLDGQELEAWLDSIQPGWREVLIKRVWLPRIEAVGLLPTAREGGLAGRPGVQVPDVSNLVLAGDWIGSAGYLADTSLASARQAAQFLLKQGLR